MSHLHNFPSPTKYSHYQSRDMCIIPIFSTFPSKPYEPRDMKGNFGKFPYWDTSESSMWVANKTKGSINKYDVTVCSDGWDNVTNRPLINIMLACISGRNSSWFGQHHLGACLPYMVGVSKTFVLLTLCTPNKLVPMPLQNVLCKLLVFNYTQL
jgi:hypothetical protein